MSEAGSSTLDKSLPQRDRDPLPLIKRSQGKFDYTELFKRAVSKSEFYEEPDTSSPHGYYKDRPIIGLDTPINGGVYAVARRTGRGVAEAVVVDDTKDPAITQVYQEVIENVKNWFGTQTDFRSRLRGVLTMIYTATSEALPYDRDKTERYSASTYGNKVSLGKFIEMKAGVCRHQNLLGGYVLERMIKDGYLDGKVSVDRNRVKNKGGHAWVRYTTPAGEVYIIDAAQRYVGKLSDISSDRWFYERPQDRPNEESKGKWFKFWKRS